MKKIILVTGASSGIGQACANELHHRGNIVYGSSRQIKKLDGVNFNPLQIDVTDALSVEMAYKQVIQEQGRLDVLINNAGAGLAGPAYAMPLDQARWQFETNFFGVVAMNNCVLPGMIANRSGLIINVSSLAGLFGLPYQSMYCASKYAIEGYSESLRMELKNCGVKVVMINPGDFKSGFTSQRKKIVCTLDNNDLRDNYQDAITAIERDENNGSNADMIAKLMQKIVVSSRPSRRYLTGDLGQRIVPFLKRMLPDQVFVKLINSHYGIK